MNATMDKTVDYLADDVIDMLNELNDDPDSPYGERVTGVGVYCDEEDDSTEVYLTNPKTDKRYRITIAPDQGDTMTHD